MSRDAGNNLRKARRFTVTDDRTLFTDRVNRKDPDDLYTFELGTRSAFNFQISGATRKIGVELYTLKRGALETFRKIGQVNFSALKKRDLNRYFKPIVRFKSASQVENSSQSLETGTYYLRVFQRSGRGNLRYALTVSTGNGGNSDEHKKPKEPGIGEGNTAPVLRINTSLNAARGTTAGITSNLLSATDDKQSATQLTYTLTQLPIAGKLELNGVPLNVGNTFTQADIDGDRLRYTNAPFKVTKIPTNGLTGVVKGISDTNVIWTNLSETNNELFFYNAVTGVTTQFTNNTTLDFLKDISGSNVIYSTDLNSKTSEVFLYNGATNTTTQLTNNNTEEAAVGISGMNALWYGVPNSGFLDFDPEVFFKSETGQTVRLTDNLTTDLFAEISGTNVVWISQDGLPLIGDTEVFYYDGATGAPPRRITNNSTNDFILNLVGDYVLWGASGDYFTPVFPLEPFPIFLQNVKTGEVRSLGDNLNFYAGISESHVAFSRFDAQGDAEVFLYEIATGKTTQITDNSVNDLYRGISGSNVILSREVSGGAELLFYDGATGVTNSLAIAPNINLGGISGSRVALSTDKEILFYEQGTTAADQFSFTISDGENGVTNGTFNITIR
jgi:Cadherin-like